MNSHLLYEPWGVGHMGDGERFWIGPPKRDGLPFPVAHVDRDLPDVARALSKVPDMIMALVQYRDDLRHGVSAESRARQLAHVELLLAGIDEPLS